MKDTEYIDEIELLGATHDRYAQIVQDYLSHMGETKCKETLMVEYQRNHDSLQLLIDNMLDIKEKAMKIIHDNGAKS